MKSYWNSYQSENHANQSKDGISITNDEVALLAERLEFFLPSLGKQYSRATFVMTVVLLLFGFLLPQALYINSMTDFLSAFLYEAVLIFMIVLPCAAAYSFYHPRLKKTGIFRACLHIGVVFSLIIMVSSILVSIAYFYILWQPIDNTSKLTLMHGIPRHLVLSIIVHVVVYFTLTLLMLLYFVKQYRQLKTLKTSFELKLAAQNDVVQARLSPHFFFNTINGLVSLVETNPDKALQNLSNIATLYRSSFSEQTEINFDQELRLCQVFLEIDEMRFFGKLHVTWDLPDEDIMYDMVISSLTLQSAIERLLHQVVELTTQKIHLNINVVWENHRVQITVTIDLPPNTFFVRHDLLNKLDFTAQAQRLEHYFGNSSIITTQIHEQQIAVIIGYPLHDPGVA